MMGLKLIEYFDNELNFLDNWLAYEDADHLDRIETIDQANCQIVNMFHDYPGCDFPCNLQVPEIMMMCWNFIVSLKKHEKGDK